MPPKHLLPNRLAIANNTLTMRRNDILKIPPIDLLHTLIPTRSISLANHIPSESLLPNRRPLRRADLCKETRQESTRRTLTSLGILFRGRHVEENIRLDERLGSLVQEDEFLVHVRINILDLKLLVENGIDFKFPSRLFQVIFLAFREYLVEI